MEIRYWSSSKGHFLLLLFAGISCQLAVVQSQKGFKESITEWVSFLRLPQAGISSFSLTSGDSLSLDCRGMSHVQKIRLPVAIEWRLHDRLLTEEGPTGRVSLQEDNGRLTVDNVNELDGGLYAAYAKTLSLARLLKLTLPTDENDTRIMADQLVLGPRIALCMYEVRINTVRQFSLRLGDSFTLNTSAWLEPVSDTMNALRMNQDEWSLAWHHRGEVKIVCSCIADCHLALNGSMEFAKSVWSLELRSLVDVKSQRRVLLEFGVTVLPALSYLESLPFEQHEYYMLSGALMIALFLLSLHLFNNLNWTPFAFDILPDEVSPKAVLDQTGVFLKQARI